MSLTIQVSFSVTYSALRSALSKPAWRAWEHLVFLQVFLLLRTCEHCCKTGTTQEQGRCQMPHHQDFFLFLFDWENSQSKKSTQHYTFVSDVKLHRSGQVYALASSWFWKDTPRYTGHQGELGNPPASISLSHNRAKGERQSGNNSGLMRHCRTAISLQVGLHSILCSTDTSKAFKLSITMK